SADPARIGELGVVVRGPHDRDDRVQVRWVLAAGDQPCRDPSVAGPELPDLSRRPRLMGEPLDQVVIILLLLRMPRAELTLALGRRAGPGDSLRPTDVAPRDVVAKVREIPQIIAERNRKIVPPVALVADYQRGEPAGRDRAVG